MRLYFSFPEYLLAVILFAFVFSTFFFFTLDVLEKRIKWKKNLEKEENSLLLCFSAIFPRKENRFWVVDFPLIFSPEKFAKLNLSLLPFGKSAIYVDNFSTGNATHHVVKGFMVYNNSIVVIECRTD